MRITIACVDPVPPGDPCSDVSRWLYEAGAMAHVSWLQDQAWLVNKSIHLLPGDAQDIELGAASLDAEQPQQPSTQII